MKLFPFENFIIILTCYLYVNVMIIMGEFNIHCMESSLHVHVQAPEGKNRSPVTLSI